MVYQQEKNKIPTPDIALALGSYRMSDAAIHARLRDFAKSYRETAVSLEELRAILQKEMGEQTLSEEIRRLRDEE